jgi:hypothetical protein
MSSAQAVSTVQAQAQAVAGLIEQIQISTNGGNQPFQPNDSTPMVFTNGLWLETYLNPNSEAGLSVAATPRRRKVQATPSSPVAAAIYAAAGKMRRGRRYHPVATRRRRYFRLAASEFGLNADQSNLCLRLHGTVESDNYQLLSTSSLLNTNWDLGDIIFWADGDQDDFPSVLMTNSMTFYRAHHANPVMALWDNTNSIEPSSANNDPGKWAPSVFMMKSNGLR